MFPGKFSDHWETLCQGTEVHLSGMVEVVLAAAAAAP